MQFSVNTSSLIAIVLASIAVVYAVDVLGGNGRERSLESDRRRFLRHIFLQRDNSPAVITKDIPLLAASENISLVTEHNNTSSDYDLSCPTWTYPTENGSCECGDTLNGAIQCNMSSQYLGIHVCYCMTYDESTGSTVAGPSVYGCTSTQGFLSLPFNNVSQLNTRMCGHLHRTGQLCGQCEEGYKQPAYFYGLKCTLCNNSSYNWLKYIVIAFLPLTVFLLIVLCFRISATSVQLNAFVFFSQVVSAPIVVIAITDTVQNWPKTLGQIGVTLYGIWNLDFFRTVFPEICLNLSSLQVLALDYAIAFYPLLLMIIFYVLIELHDSNCRPIVYMWKPFYKCLARFRSQWNIRASTVDAFATFLLLSYVKLLTVSGALLFPRWVYNEHHRKIGLYLYYDAAIRYFSEEHLPYAIVALAVVFIFILAPLLLLILYPMRCFQRCLGRFRVRWHALHIFADSFQGCYKDGTNGTRDCRYFAALYLLVRIIMQIILESSSSVIVFIWESITVFVFSILIAVLQPYKHRYYLYNTIDTVLAVLLAVFLMISFAFSSINNTTTVNFFVKRTALIGLLLLMSLLPLAYLLYITLAWLCCSTRLRNKCYSRMLLLRRDSQNFLPDRLVNPDHYSEEPSRVTVVAANVRSRDENVSGELEYLISGSGTSSYN